MYGGSIVQTNKLRTRNYQAKKLLNNEIKLLKWFKIISNNQTTWLKRAYQTVE